MMAGAPLAGPLARVAARQVQRDAWQCSEHPNMATPMPGRCSDGFMLPSQPADPSWKERDHLGRRQHSAAIHGPSGALCSRPEQWVQLGSLAQPRWHSWPVGQWPQLPSCLSWLFFTSLPVPLCCPHKAYNFLLVNAANDRHGSLKISRKICVVKDNAPIPNALSPKKTDLVFPPFHELSELFSFQHLDNGFICVNVKMHT